MRLVVSEAARADLRAVYAYYEKRNPAIADRVAGTILKAASSLLTFPLIGRVGDVAGTRERPVLRYPYRIVYAPEDETVVVVRVVRGAQDWP